MGISGGQAAAPPAAPAQVDLRQWFSPIENQGTLESCTANAAAGLVEYFERRANNRYGDTGAYLRTAVDSFQRMSWSKLIVEGAERGEDSIWLLNRKSLLLDNGKRRGIRICSNETGTGGEFIRLTLAGVEQITNPTLQ